MKDNIKLNFKIILLQFCELLISENVFSSYLKKYEL